jgi:hypothetical protein
MPKITSGRANSIGLDLMKRINDGDIRKAPAAQIERVREAIIENCEEMLEVGARIRPLMVGELQIGWVRGLHQAERKTLKRWVRNPNDYILNTLLLATTFTQDEVERMGAVEVRSLAEVVQRMSEYDASLLPYMSAFVTSSASETMWYGRGEALTSWENKTVLMPDGKKMRLLAPSDHARLWAALCSYREQAKKRLEENFNALFIVRPWAGKSADPIANELKAVQRQLEQDSTEPWERVVRVKEPINKDDGWAHPGDTLEDLQRELKGMMEGDKHEKLMDEWAKQIASEAKERAKKLEELRKKRGTEHGGVIMERIQVLTEKQIRDRQEALKKGKAPSKSPGAVERKQETDAFETQIDKFIRYSR